MTQTEERPATALSASDRAEAWFASFEDALAARDVERAAGMFAATSFWRDLVAFTWNLKTVEDPDGVDPSAVATYCPPCAARVLEYVPRGGVYT